MRNLDSKGSCNGDINRKLGPDMERNIFNTRSEKALERFWGKTGKKSSDV